MIFLSLLTSFFLFSSLFADTRTQIPGGMSNDLWMIHTTSGSHLLRKPKERQPIDSFQKMCELAQQAGEQGLAPRIISYDLDEQTILQDYIPHLSWPSYESDSHPYHETMRQLAKFHQTMHVDSAGSYYSPFNLIFTTDITHRPFPFSEAREKIELIYQALLPWLEKHAVVCHGDLTRGNVLLPASRTAPLLIDFDSAAWGDPFFDVVKFSVYLKENERQALLQTYLGQRAPTPQESAHFALMDITFLLLVAHCRFSVAQTLEGEPLTEEEMADILDPLTPTPSYLAFSFQATDAKSWQSGALYALKEFLDCASPVRLQKIIEEFEKNNH